ncbi:hypothetical protein [Chlorobaculum thiosulfatiphilum]|uniref:hypothetical protein n=1 Tax=Chlorobaculum thiosulfatiphilum TaxID=115852 RepID=UPI0014771599|nr:hypothetical protein [Chlorobaculum thiosulfatiphilum]
MAGKIVRLAFFFLKCFKRRGAEIIDRRVCESRDDDGSFGLIPGGLSEAVSEAEGESFFFVLFSLFALSF